MMRIFGELEDLHFEVMARAERQASVFASTRPGSNGDDALSQLRDELAGLQKRKAFWQARLRQLIGLDHDPVRRLLSFGGLSVQLTRRESELIDPLISKPGQVVAMGDLLRAWGASQHSEVRVRNFVVQLRRKLASLEVPAAIAQ